MTILGFIAACWSLLLADCYLKVETSVWHALTLLLQGKKWNSRCFSSLTFSCQSPNSPMRRQRRVEGRVQQLEIVMKKCGHLEIISKQENNYL